jgi:hypothetical protein
VQLVPVPLQEVRILEQIDRAVHKVCKWEGCKRIGL